MRLKLFQMLSILSGVVFVSIGCDFSAGSDDNRPPPPPPPPPGVKNPLLTGVEPEILQICAGDEIQLIGKNFGKELSENEVSFVAGLARIPGIPIEVENRETSSGDTDSRLRVIVPGGISTGNVELQVGGISAGAIGYEACPQIMAYTLARNETLSFLTYEGPLGFRQPSFINLYGINFNDLTEINFEDSTGQMQRILPNTVERGTIAGTPTGYSKIGFNLHDPVNNDIRLFFTDVGRDNIKISIKGPAGVSNTIEVPVFNTGNQAEPGLLGANINVMKVPTGIRTGPVRIYYSIYDDAVNHSYKMDISWTVDGGQSFFPARPDVTDPLNDGTVGILPGTLAHKSTHTLFPGGGAIRVFTWDAPNDSEFQKLNTASLNGVAAPRHWAVQFRLKPIPDPVPLGRFPFPPTNYVHQTMTPSIVYYSLEDRPGGLPGDDVSGERSFTLVEDFITNVNEDTKLTTADWGPPTNQDALSGVLSLQSSQFGEGTAEITLKNTPLEEREVDTKDEYIEVNTDTMTVVQKQIADDNGTPCELSDDISAAGANAIRTIDFPNPGAAKKEFHLATLFIEKGVKVLVRGPNPFILRLRGKGPTPPADEVVFKCAAGVTCDLSGCNGEDTPRVGGADLPGRGGAGGPGSGAGGSGATLVMALLRGIPGVASLTQAEAGGKAGGQGGETTASWDSAPVTGTKIPGGPGGGGGHQTAGGTGDPGRSTPFRPKGGLGGPKRGDGELLELTPGSGGGGGGATVIADVKTSTFTWVGGGGGGGGGGVLHLVAKGAVEIDPSAKILANGGNGGSSKADAKAGAAAAGAPGGGGSGGSILVQAAGPLELTCTNIQTNGGNHGTAGSAKAPPVQNDLPGSGDGGDGWIRLESAAGGVPTCVAFLAETTLAKEVKGTVKALDVASTQDFPESGTVIVEGEEISYKGKTLATFDGITRAPMAPGHAVGTPVVLKGAIAPYEKGILAESGIVPSPDPVEGGRGRDAELQLPFEPTIDPATKELIRDPETDQALSVYFFDTDKGEIRRPDGSRFYRTAVHDRDPGLLDLARLTIPQNTVLRGIGSRALRISIADQADIAGWIDVSGSSGGLLRFPADEAAKPLPGLGGRAGAGGGDGGDGGYIEYVNGNAKDKRPENTIPIPGEPGQAPPETPDGLDETPFPYGDGNPADEFVMPSFTRATPGASVPGEATPCTDCKTTAGGGAGGGNLRKGADGAPLPLGGLGGSAFGLETLRFGGSYWYLGGTGGSGGGGSPHLSADYVRGIPGKYHFGRQAVHAPGTGGGGGGGVLHLFGKNLSFHSTARLLARGGNAFQSIDLGGNGGGGAGGTILVQVSNSLTIEQGARFDVTGGVSNVTVPTLPGQENPEYEGNVRVGPPSSLRGDGGNGSPGRIRIEAEQGSRALAGGINTSISSGPFLIDTVASRGVSKALRLGVGPGGVASSHAIALEGSAVDFFEFGQPQGTDTTLLWEGAPESLDQHAAPGPLIQRVRDPRDLRDREFVRFLATFLSNVTTQRSQAINEVRLPYRLPSPSDN